MKKLLVTAVASCAVIAFAPASALAHKHHRHHHHHARVHHRTFGSDQGSATGQGQDQNAGTVQSFNNGVLTILLGDMSTVSGKVTSATDIECQAPESPAMHDDGDQGSGNDQANNDDRGDDNGQGDDAGLQDRNDQGDDNGQGDDEHAGQTCDMSNLTPGTVVREATLSVSNAGAIWNNIELVTSSSNPEPSDS
jgi:hypothetical protein